MSSSVDATIGKELLRMELIESSDEGRDVGEIHDRLLEMSDSLPGEAPPAAGTTAPYKGSNPRLPLEAMRKMKRKVRRRREVKKRSSSYPTPPRTGSAPSSDGELVETGGSSPPKRTRKVPRKDKSPQSSLEYDFGLDDEWMDDEYVDSQEEEPPNGEEAMNLPPDGKETMGNEDEESLKQAAEGKIESEGGKKGGETPRDAAVKATKTNKFDPTLLSPEALARGPLYMVAQWITPQRLSSPAGVVAIMTNPHPFWDEQHWPTSVFIRTAGTRWLFARRAKSFFEKQRVKLGSRLFIKDVSRRVNSPTKLVALHEPENTRAGEIHWAHANKRFDTYSLQYTATAGMAKVLKVPRREEKVVGIVTGRREDGSIGVHAVGTECSTFLRQFESDLSIEGLRVADLVEVTVSRTSPFDGIGRGYLLPLKAKWKLGTEIPLRKGGFITRITGRKKYPSDSEGKIRQLGDKMALGAQLTAEGLRLRAENTTFVGKVRKDDEKLLTITIGRPNWDKRRFVEHFEAWKEDSQLNIRLQPHDQYPVATGKIISTSQKLGLNGVAEWQFDVKLRIKPLNEGEEVEERLLQEPQVAIQIMPAIRSLRQQAEFFARDEFMETALARSSQGTLIRRMLNLEQHSKRLCSEGADHDHGVSLLEGRTTEQKRTICEMVCPDRPLNLGQGSAAGTGKTDTVIAGALEELRRNGKARIVMLTPMNVPTLRMARGLVERVTEILQSQCPDMDEESLKRHGALLIIGYTAQKRYEPLVKEFKGMMMGSQVKDWDSAVAEKETTGLEDPDADRPNQQSMERFFEEHDPRVILCTTAMAEREPSIMDRATMIVFDEATHEPMGRAIHLVAMAPDVEIVVSTGDMKQKHVFNDDKPHVLRSWKSRLGSQPLLWEILRGEGAIQTYLSINWRSHPLITQLLSEAFYSGKEGQGGMTAGVDPRARQLVLRNSAKGRIRLAQRDYPIVILHSAERHQPEANSNSIVNDSHSLVAAKIVQKLRWALMPDANKIPETGEKKPLIGVLCLYSGQRRNLEEKLKHCKGEVAIVNSDGYQGSDCHVAVGVTSYSRGDNVPDDPAQFILESERALVFTSRAREGMFLIGNIHELMKGPAWRRFLEEFTCSVPILDAQHYTSMLTSGGHKAPFGEYDEGTGLLLDKGRIPCALGLPPSLYKWQQRLNTHQKDALLPLPFRPHPPLASLTLLKRPSPHFFRNESSSAFPSGSQPSTSTAGPRSSTPVQSRRGRWEAPGRRLSGARRVSGLNPNRG